MFSRLLIANRGEIACRITRTAQAMGIHVIAVHSEADAESAHVALADEAVGIGPPPAAQSYLDSDAVLAAAAATNAEAVHPGYGFLSENAAFARAVQAAGMTWIGPPPEAIAAVGDKRAARDLMAAAGVPVGGGGAVEGADDAIELAATTGYPVIVKAAAGGGGMGMRVAADDVELKAAVEAVAAQAGRLFGDPSLLVERYLPDARHVELQLLGLADGRIVVLGERDCSVQRRYQKVVEESPSPGVDDALRRRMAEAVRAGAGAIGYRGAGTFECLVADGEFVFLEVNARLQVEHPVTEMVTGIDLVAEQFRVAAGVPPGFDPDAVSTQGHAIELRVCAEDPQRFLPRPGTITGWLQPTGPGVRVDAGYRAGDVVSPHYDNLLAKLVVHGNDRTEALDRAADAVAAFSIQGVTTNLPFLAEVLADGPFRSGDYTTGLVARLRG